MTWPRVRFMAAPSSIAAVRYDCNDLQAAAPRRVVEFDPGVPTLQGDPDSIGQQWGFRSPSLVQRVKGTKAQALAALSALSKEQLRRTNWVMFQLSADTAPVWFKTYRTGYEPLSLERVDVDKTSGRQGRTPDAWEIRVPLVADAFTYGERVTASAVTVGSSLSATNPLQFALPALKGDASTALRVTLTPGTGDVRGVRLVCVCGDDTVVAPVVDIGSSDGFTAGTGTAAGTTSTAALGGSWRVVTIAAGSNNLLQRLSGTVTPPAGRYKVLAKVEATPQNSSTPNRYSFAFGQAVATVATYGTTSMVDTPAFDGTTADTFRGWVDLGEFTFPRNVTTPVDLAATQPPTTWYLKVGTPAGTAGTVRLDALKLIPVDGPTIRATTLLRTTLANSAYYLLSSAAYAMNWDGDTETTWKHTVSTGALLGDEPVYIQTGAYLVADPAAAQNLLITLPDGNASSATGTWSVVVSYYPRYLHLGDGS